MKSSIAFLDFDGTVTSKDTLFQFILFSFGWKGLLYGLLVNSPYLAFFKLGLMTNQTAKEKLLTHFFKDMSESAFNSLCTTFVHDKLPDLIRTKAISEITRLQLNNTVIVVVSASPENWVGIWADQKGLLFICTKLEVVNDKLTGKIKGKNCAGIEKVNRIYEKFNLKDFTDVYAYGDTKEDLPMLKLAKYSNYKPFE